VPKRRRGGRRANRAAGWVRFKPIVRVLAMRRLLEDQRLIPPPSADEMRSAAASLVELREIEEALRCSKCQAVGFRFWLSINIFAADT